MVWALGEARATGTSSVLSIHNFPKYISSSLQIFDNNGNMITMVKISRCWRKFVVLFLKACFFCLRSFQRSTWSENGMGRYQGYFRVCRWNWSKRKLANICKCNSSFFCCQHSKPMQWFWRLATLPRWTDQLLSFIGLQYICLQSLASHVCFWVLFSINVLEPNCQNWIKNMVNDLWSCADQWQQLLDQKCYLVVDVNSTYRSSIKMGGSSKMAWIAAIRTTRYPLILMFCCDVFMFLVKEEVFSDEDLEWPFLSCLFYGKYFFQAFRSIAK